MFTIGAHYLVLGILIGNDRHPIPCIGNVFVLVMVSLCENRVSTLSTFIIKKRRFVSEELGVVPMRKMNSKLLIPN